MALALTLVLALLPALAMALVLTLAMAAAMGLAFVRRRAEALASATVAGLVGATSLQLGSAEPAPRSLVVRCQCGVSSLVTEPPYGRVRTVRAPRPGASRGRGEAASTLGSCADF